MKATIGEGQNLSGEIEVPGGDMTNAAAWIIAAVTAHHDANITIKGVDIDPARTGLIDALLRMGARLEVQKRREVDGKRVADIWVRSSWLRPSVVEEELAARMLNELPLFAVAAAVTDGTTVIRGFKNLHAQDPARFDAIAGMLDKMETYVQQGDEELRIEGDEHFHGGDFDSGGDPSIGLALGVAALIAAENLTVDNAECVETVYPGFWEELKRNTGAGVLLS